MWQELSARGLQNGTQFSSAWMRYASNPPRLSAEPLLFQITGRC